MLVWNDERNTWVYENIVLTNDEETNDFLDHLNKSVPNK